MVTEADVLRLFVSSEAAFLSGSKRRQAGYITGTKRWVVHNDSDDTLAFGVSDDSLQLLLAGTQTATGDKTWGGVQTFQAAVSMLDNLTIAAHKTLKIGPSTGAAFTWNSYFLAITSLYGDIKATAPNFSQTGNFSVISGIAKLDAVALNGRASLGSGYIDAATARSNETSIIGKSRIFITPANFNEDVFALGDKVDGQTIMIKNLSGGIGAGVDMDETGGLYIPAGSTLICIWDATDDKWYYR